jgi:hypothetical protein
LFTKNFVIQETLLTDHHSILYVLAIISHSSQEQDDEDQHATQEGFHSEAS